MELKSIIQRYQAPFIEKYGGRLEHKHHQAMAATLHC